ncbi:hypothetical protein UACE39S_04679 [Ureibacillus acetophenoni]
MVIRIFNILRAGNFYMDKDGYLVNGDGKYLVGSAANVITTQTPILTFKLEDPSATDVGDDKYAGLWIVIVISLNTDYWLKRTGMINICIPHVVLEPIIQNLSVQYWMPIEFLKKRHQ